MDLSHLPGWTSLPVIYGLRKSPVDSVVSIQCKCSFSGFLRQGFAFLIIFRFSHMQTENPNHLMLCPMIHPLSITDIIRGIPQRT